MIKDLSGQTFGMLTVISFCEIRNHKAYWNCKCSCGTEKAISSRALVSGSTVSCGCNKNKKASSRLKKNLTNQRFGRLIALHEVGRDIHHNVIWRCKCDCGNEVDVRANSLLSGNTLSCGCYNKDIVHKSQFINLTNKRFGRLLVLGIHHNVDKVYYWDCRCDCGNLVVVGGTSLKVGHTKSCGCYKLDRVHEANCIDLVGKRFGSLVCIGFSHKNSDGVFYWDFKCDCGNIKTIRGDSVRNGKTKSCGCLDTSHGGSSVENEIKCLVETLTNKKASKSKVLDGKEIDIFFEDLNFGIEYNGSAYHASLNGIYKDLPKDYHQNKFLLAKEKGIHLMSIFDVDWNDRLKNFLINKFSPKEKIFARKCEIKSISKDIANKFCDLYHLQGGQRLSSICYGLYYSGELISVMTFGKLRNRVTKEGQYELHRYAIKNNVYVVGGAEKLFKAFIKDNEFTEIISYSNNDLFLGNVYERLGFSYDGQASIRYYWFLGQSEIKREKCQLKYLKDKYPNLYAESLSQSSKEDYIMTKLGARKVYRCGNTRWLYKRI